MHIYIHIFINTSFGNIYTATFNDSIAPSHRLSARQLGLLDDVAAHHGGMAPRWHDAGWQRNPGGFGQ